MVCVAPPPAVDCNRSSDTKRKFGLAVAYTLAHSPNGTVSKRGHHRHNTRTHSRRIEARPPSYTWPTHHHLGLARRQQQEHQHQQQREEQHRQQGDRRGLCLRPVSREERRDPNQTGRALLPPRDGRRRAPPGHPTVSSESPRRQPPRNPAPPTIFSEAAPENVAAASRTPRPHC